MHTSQVKWCLAFGDGVALLVAWLTALLVVYVTAGVGGDMLPLVIVPSVISGVMAMIVALIFIHLGHYSYHQPWLSQWGAIVKVCCVALILDCGLHYYLVGASYLWSVSFWVVLLALLPAARRLVFRLLSYLDAWHMDITVIGHAKACMRSVLVLHAQRYLGYRVERIIILDSEDQWDAHQLPTELDDTAIIFEPVSPANSLLDAITELTLIAPEHIPIGPELNACMSELQEHRLDYMLIKPLELQPSSMHRAQPVIGQQLWVKATLFAKFSMPLSQLLKRCFDLLVSVMMLLVLSPLMVYYALRIGKDGGPVIQGVRTAGKDGHEFVRYEFRTQVKNPDQALASLLAQDPYAQKLLDANQPLPFDPRISSLGRSMQQTGVHRLPQLWNVLKGDMSMVGPEPIAADQLGQHLPYFVTSYGTLRPGMCSIELPYDSVALGDDQRAAMLESYRQHWRMADDLASCIAKLNIS